MGLEYIKSDENFIMVNVKCDYKSFLTIYFKIGI